VQQVAQSVNGQEALAAVEARGGGDAFDVLLIDLHMPLMGGMEVRLLGVYLGSYVQGSKRPSAEGLAAPEACGLGCLW
jgi:hypothetical protein